MDIKEKLNKIRNAIEELDTALSETTLITATRNKFSYLDFLHQKVAVHCETEEDSRVFLAYLIGKGLKWIDGACLTNTMWDSRTDQTCYVCGFEAGEQIGFASMDFYLSNGYKVIKFNFDMLAEADDD